VGGGKGGNGEKKVAPMGTSGMERKKGKREKLRGGPGGLQGGRIRKGGSEVAPRLQCA